MKITYLGDNSDTNVSKVEMGGIVFRLNVATQIPPDKEPLFVKLRTNRFFYVTDDDSDDTLPDPPAAVDPVAFASGQVPAPVPSMPAFRSPVPEAARQRPQQQSHAAPQPVAAPPSQAQQRPPGSLPVPPSQKRG
ncbi:MAG: hypothetical protein E6Q97_31145 [Desulfurellales bacterium]|nr:MAG: hypothetical protein E6Q97_31145 [Desulfurellales bacterium]